MGLRFRDLNRLALACLAWALVTSGVHAQEAAPKSLSVEVREALQGCFQCHGPNGVSVIPTRPTIAGQKAEYVNRQLVAFKNAARAAARQSGGEQNTSVKGAPRRTDPVMEHMAAGLPDRLIAPLAQAVSQLRCDGKVGKAPRDPVRDQAQTMDRPQAAEVCVVCHGADGIGVQNQVPNLAGQQRSYLRRQLLLLRETAWGARPREGEAWRSHPIMEAKAARMSITDIDALAQYYSGMDCWGAAPAK